MPFENLRGAPKRVAVIGAGISGLGAAHLLAKGNQVVLFEAEKRLGGHARTVIAGKRGDQPVDTGFIVFNHGNYPNLVRLFDELNVPVAKSNMSFGASISNGRLEYALRDLNGIYGTRLNTLRPQFHRMILDILRFNRLAEGASSDPNLTIGELISQLKLGAWFREYYLLPMCGAIWSTPKSGILDFPAKTLVQFFKNHLLLTHKTEHQWYTVQGGSIEYVNRLQNALNAAGVDVRSGAPVKAVRRIEGGVLVRTDGAEWEPFDEVVFATHSDDTLSMLTDADPDERDGLRRIRYQDNEAVLHADTNLMPRRKRCWASWVYCEPQGSKKDRIDLTYWMNSLQPIPHDDPLFVTLNATDRIREDLIYDVTNFRHPVYDLDAQIGRAKIAQIQGQRSTWFCGAWIKNGFHEDGLSSAVDVVNAMAERQVAQLAAE